MAQAETWKAIPGLAGYEASDHGRIRKIVSMILKPDFDPYHHQSYPRVYVGGKRTSVAKRKRFMVHVLVAKAFIGECPHGYVHNHKDGNKGNPRPENLEFVTRSENLQHAYDVLDRPRNQGSKHGMSKLTETDVVSIRKHLADGLTLDAVSTKFGVSLSTVSMIKRRKIWQHV